MAAGGRVDADRGALVGEEEVGIRSMGSGIVVDGGEADCAMDERMDR